MENISYGKIVLIGAGHVGSAILDSLLRMNLADEIVVINRNQKKIKQLLKRSVFNLILSDISRSFQYL